MRRIWLAALAGVLACGCDASTPSGDQPSPATRTSYDAKSPVGLVAVGQSVWTVEAAGNDVVDTLSPNSDRVHVGATPLRAAYDGHLLWVTVFGAGQVVAIDPATKRVVRRVPMPGQPEGIVSAFGGVWVVRQQARLLTEIGPSGRGRSFPLGNEPRLVTANDAALFVSNFGAGTVTRVDPSTGKERTSRHLCNGAQGLAATAAVVWMTCTPDNAVVAVDATTLRVVGRVAVDGEPDAIRLVNGRLFVVTTTGPTIVELATDPSHPVVLHTTALGHAAPLLDQANVDAVMAGGRWWVSSPGENRVVVYQP